MMDLGMVMGKMGLGMLLFHGLRDHAVPCLLGRS